MNIQIKADKWYTPQELCKLLRRTMNQVKAIIKKYKCVIKTKDEGIFVHGRTLSDAFNPTKKNRK